MKLGERFAIAPAGEPDLPGVMMLLDRVFVLPKQRAPSFAARYPAVCASGDRSDVWVIKEHGVVTACAAVKYRTWRTMDRSFRLAMIGGVCTDPAARGRGMASQLLAHADMAARERWSEATVLWTTSGPFYERLGWALDDPGLFGKVGGWRGADRATAGRLSVGPPTACADQIERIRSAWLGEGIAREAVDYAAIPFPARSVDCLIADVSDHRAYALVGREGPRGYVYEAVGSAQAFRSLWTGVCDRYPEVYVNDHAGGETARWLNEHAHVEWQQRPLAMWRGTPRCSVPFFDRL